VVPLCDRCHGAALAWQWALGVIRRETGELANRKHEAPEREWAQLTGVVILAALAGTVAPEVWDAIHAVTAYSIHLTEALDEPARFGPDPLRNDAHPRPRQSIMAEGAADWAGMLELIGEASNRLGVSPELFAPLARAADSIVLAARRLDAGVHGDEAIVALNMILQRLGGVFRADVIWRGDASEINRRLQHLVDPVTDALVAVADMAARTPAESSADLARLAERLR
jgi:hypothetical protein